jgi:hypothetical protein
MATHLKDGPTEGRSIPPADLTKASNPELSSLKLLNLIELLGVKQFTPVVRNILFK